MCLNNFGQNTILLNWMGIGGAVVFFICLFIWNLWDFELYTKFFFYCCINQYIFVTVGCDRESFVIYRKFSVHIIFNTIYRWYREHRLTKKKPGKIYIYFSFLLLKFYVKPKSIKRQVLFLIIFYIKKRTN